MEGLWREPRARLEARLARSARWRGGDAGIAGGGGLPRAGRGGDGGGGQPARLHRSRLERERQQAARWRSGGAGRRTAIAGYAATLAARTWGENVGCGRHARDAHSPLRSAPIGGVARGGCRVAVDRTGAVRTGGGAAAGQHRGRSAGDRPARRGGGRYDASWPFVIATGGECGGGAGPDCHPIHPRPARARPHGGCGGDGADSARRPGELRIACGLPRRHRHRRPDCRHPAGVSRHVLADSRCG